jgi:transposase-like protein
MVRSAQGTAQCPEWTRPFLLGLSYRDVEELLAERGVQVDHVSVFRWVQRFTPLLAEAARACWHRVGDRWWVDETYVKASGRWRYVYGGGLPVCSGGGGPGCWALYGGLR